MNANDPLPKNSVASSADANRADASRADANKAADPPKAWRVEGIDRKRNPAPPSRPGGAGGSGHKINWRRVLIVGGALLIVNQLLFSVLRPSPTRIRLPYNVFRAQLSADNVAEVHSKGDSIEGTLKTAVPDPKKPKSLGKIFLTERPTFAEGDGLYAELERMNVEVNAKSPSTSLSAWQSALFGFGPTLLLLILLFSAQRRMSGALGGIGGIGRSKAKRYELAGQTRTTFEDVAGIDDAEDELVEIVDFLKNPQKYRALGASIPKGVLLSGLPGTGKTLLARAVAGEADVPFFSMAASEFIEMIVGVGASRVRDLFNEAKAVAPAIVFIDEIDSIGRSRGGNSAMGGNDEREQTLNQILTEMDGFTGSEGVIVLAATNRPEILDAALLRPGRFDRHVVVSAPDQAGRQKILEVHSTSVPLAADVDLGGVASTTPGMVGADLKNLVNEAALLAARRGHQQVQNADFTDAMEKIVLGTERKLVLSRADRERTAYHESGHALLGMLQPGADPVRKISIIPRGTALGVTFQSPDNDRYSYDADYLRGRIVGALGGRAAEQVIYGNVTTGAESDLDTVTRIARAMVGRWGMSDAIGPLTVLPGPNDQVMFGESPMSASSETRALVDKETRRIVEECYGVALAKLGDHRMQLDALATALLERETLDELDAYAIAGIDRPDRVSVS